MSWYTRTPLWARVLVGLIVGGGLGLMFRATGADGAIETADAIGKAFVGLIRLLITPLIVTTLIAGVIAMGDPKRLGSLGARAIGLYLGTTALAVTIGLVMGGLVQPGSGVAADLSANASDIDTITGRLASAGDASFAARFLSVDPAGALGAFFTDPVRMGLAAFLIAMAVLAGRGRSPVVTAVMPVLVIVGVAIASLNIITLIVLTLIAGVLILVAKLEGIGRTVEEAADVTMKATTWVMELAPFGVAALMAWVMGEHGFGVLQFLLKLAVTLYVACILHIILVYGGIVKGLLGLPLVRFFRGVIDPQSVAFSTASSSATLPVTIDAATRNLGVKRSVAGSVLPLGATINMDGTAIYLGIVALFAAQAFGVPLSMVDYVLIAATATLASVGAAGIPSAGLFLANTVMLSIAGPDGTPAISPEQATLIIAFIFPFDRLLDMMRTMTNVTGDLAVSSAVAKWQGELDEDQFRAPAV